MTSALLVCAAPQVGAEDLIAAIAPRFDVVIGVDAGGATCLEAGITPTLLVGDFDSIDVAFLDEATALGMPMHRYPSDKDRTDIDLALGEARAMGVSRIAVTAATTERLDHTLGVLAALAGAADLAPEIVEPNLNGWLLAKRGRREIRLDGAGATVSILPVTPLARVSARGVRWPLEHADITNTGTVGISNVVCTDAASVSIQAGVAFVLSPRTHVPPAEESRCRS